ncbi:DUF3152 domain-containing protein [Blastococcus montanus]|uniref:DUF3152 domain-containing protein n=1 Tax=Blastococcus montanus TaxID=3144973 RepID=UPI003207BF18
MSWHLRMFLAMLLALTTAGVLPAAPAQAQSTITYTVTAQGTVYGDLDHFARVASETLNDPRGWSLGGALRFDQVASGGNFSLILASPAVVANAAPGCSSEWSCRVGRNVYINDQRWRGGTDSWPHGLDLYQRYVILHEVGHWLGLGHRDCPTPGRTAWVMQQQSISLQGCRANVWPVIAEREQAARNRGVSVNWSAIEARYRALGQESGVLGPPITWEKYAGADGGHYQHFAGGYGGGSIYWSPSTGAHEVYGEIRDRWEALGWERGVLGYPITGERSTADGVGRYNAFAGGYGGGSIHWSPSTGAHETYGEIRDRWEALGWEQGVLGYPITGERGTADGVGRYNHFAGGYGGGSIYWSPSTGAHEVYGQIRDRWESSGWEQGPLGYPVSGEYDVPGGRRSDFQNGYIRWDRATSTTELVITG